MKIKDLQEPSLDEKMCPVTIDDAQNIYTYNPTDDYHAEVSKSSAFVYGVESFKQQTKEILPALTETVGALEYGAGKAINKYFPDGLPLFNGQLKVKVGDTLKESGKVLIQAADRNYETLSKQYAKENPRLEQAQESILFDFGNQGANWTTMLLSGPYAGLTMGGLILGGESKERMQKYKAEHGSIEGYEEQADKDAVFNLANAYVQGLEEKYLGAFAQVKAVKKGMGIVKAVTKNAIQESAITEPIQEGTDFIFDRISGFDTKTELGERLRANLRGFVVAGIFGGAGGFASALYHRSVGIENYKEALKDTVPEQDLEKVATKAYEQDAKTMRDIVTIELEESSSLNAKRGGTYENMYKATLQAMQNAKKQGGYSEVSEVDLAVLAKEEANKFADWTLAEANRRKTTIDSVIDASTIYYDKGKLHIGMTNMKGVAESQSEVELPRSMPNYEEEKDGFYLGDVNEKGEIYPIVENIRKVFGEDIANKVENRDSIRKGLKNWSNSIEEIMKKEPSAQEQFLRETLEVAKSEEEVSSILEYAETLIGQTQLTNLLYDISVTNKASKETQDRAKKIYDRLYEPMESMREATPLFQESLDLAEQNARLDDIYPEYEGETINIDGTEKTVYNSNGDRIAKSEQALRNFYKWFGDSKVVDEQGRPKVMYHGTPNADFTELREGTYFTDMEWYAQIYKNQGASSFGYKKEARKPDVYSVYLKMEKPFDTRNKKERDIFNKYFYQQWGTGTPLQDKGLPDWNDGNDLKEFLEEHKDWGYDGILLDEGGLPDGNGGVKSRGISYVSMNRNQIKSTDNRGTYSLEDDNIYYQDEDKDLVVYHGMSQSSAEKALDFGGLPVPSIAIVNKDLDYETFGEIKLVGNKDIIDPKDKRNEVYNRDIWSKTFPEEAYKPVKSQKYKDFRDKYSDAFKKVGAENEFSSILGTAQNKNPVYAIRELQGSTGMKNLYVEEVLGKKIEIPMTNENKKRLDSILLGRESDEQFIQEVLEIPEDAKYEEYRDKLIQSIKDLTKRNMEQDSSVPNDKKEKFAFYLNEGLEERINFGNADHIIFAVKRYQKDKDKLEVDTYAFKDKLDEAIKDKEEYYNWVKNIAEEELVGEPMIDMGNKLVPFTQDNVLAYMTKGVTKNAEASLFAAPEKTIAAGAKKLKSIAEIKKEGKKLVSPEQSKQVTDSLKEALKEFSANFSTDEDFSTSMRREEDAIRGLGNYISGRAHTKEALKLALQKEIYTNEDIPDEVLKEGMKIADNIIELSRYYFEAKPQRLVGFEEFSGVIIPTDKIYDKVASRFEEKGLKVVRTDSPTNKAIKEFDNVLFQAGKKHHGSIEFKGGEALIELTDSANASTLPHELAHYWLENTFLYTKSGLASPEYAQFYKSIADFLGIQPDQEKLERWQQEKWARSYEQYLLTQKAPSPELENAFKNYNKWIKRAYRYLKSKPKYRNSEGKMVEPKLTPEIIETFGRLTNEFVARPDIEEMAETVTPELEKAVEEYETKVNEEIKQAEKETISDYTRVREQAEEGDSGRSSVAMRVLGEELGYDVKNIKDQMESARKFVRNNLKEARRVAMGGEAPKGLLSTAVNIAYVEAMEKSGNYKEAEKATRIRSLEQTRRGQEIAMERATTDNVLSAEYWSNMLLARKAQEVAKKSFNGDVKALQDFIKKNAEDIAKAIEGKDKEERKKIIKEKLEENNLLYQEDYDDLVDAESYDEILNETQIMIEDSLGLKAEEEQVDFIHNNVRILKDIVDESVSENGNLSVEAFRQIRKMHDTIESYSPSSNIAVWSSIIGRGLMLASVKSPVLNIISNTENYLTETLSRKAQNGISGKTNDNIVDDKLIKDYLNWSKQVYKASGYMPSVTTDILGETPILGEKRLSSQGKGTVRALGRLAEDTVFKYLMGYPDSVFKDYNFVDVVANKATQKAFDEGLKGEQAVKRANELFEDAILLKPETDEGAEIRKQGMIAAHEATFTQDSEISKIALKIRDVLNSGEFKAGDFLVPFVKTPANVVALGLEYSLGAIYTGYHVQDIMKDPTSEVSQRAIKAAVRNGVGMLLAMMLAALVDDDDYLPEYDNASPKQRDLAKLKNAPFNSVKIGSKWINLDYFGPLAIPMAGVLTARSKQNLSGFLQGIGGQAMKTPGVKDITNLIGSTSRAIQYGVSFKDVVTDTVNWGVEQVASRSIPAFVNDFGKLIDSYERETGGEMSRRVMSKIPFVRETLPIRTDVLGRKVETEPTNLFFGARVKTAVDNKVVEELDRLGRENKAPTLSDPTRYGSFRKLETKVKDKVRAEFGKEYGKEVKELMNSYSYKNGDDSRKQKLLNKVRSKITKDLKRKYLKNNK